MKNTHLFKFIKKNLTLQLLQSIIFPKWIWKNTATDTKCNIQCIKVTSYSIWGFVNKGANLPNYTSESHFVGSVSRNIRQLEFCSKLMNMSSCIKSRFVHLFNAQENLKEW